MRQMVREIELPEEPDLSHVGGFDFGLRTFLTDHTGKTWRRPLFLREVLRRVRYLKRCLSRQQGGSHHRVADQRRDFHYKLTHALCKEYDVLVFETLHLVAMKRVWGRKVSDLGFAKFLVILKQVAFKHSKLVITIDRFTPTTQTCSGCGHRQHLILKQRWFTCPHCGLSLGRDHNAAINIRRAGASAPRAEG